MTIEHGDGGGLFEGSAPDGHRRRAQTGGGHLTFGGDEGNLRICGLEFQPGTGANRAIDPVLEVSGHAEGRLVAETNENEPVREHRDSLQSGGGAHL